MNNHQNSPLAYKSPTIPLGARRALATQDLRKKKPFIYDLIVLDLSASLACFDVCDDVFESLLVVLGKETYLALNLGLVLDVG